ncbi:MAG TPA: monofunctional biosynthetic peptidoglycan transglycosylase [Candidatus Eisenbacteria bacterium]|nr:monofunctional biosynthetic peptidoglycan transglycosylase [Candidatus Eisenbacteria bacterium]
MKKVLVKTALVTLAVSGLVYFYLSLPDVVELKNRNPRTTALIELREREYRGGKGLIPRQQVWVPYRAISEHLKTAVILGEDSAFFSHKGIDFNELKETLRTDWETMSFKRGASTITMQLARNLYLSPAKSPLRKLKEIIIAWQLEYALSKQRILELYLNVAEWGRHIYGAEAAARHYFGKPAAALNPLEAATLAALLPSPRTPMRKDVRYRRNLILGRMAARGYISEAEYAAARQTALFEKTAAPPATFLSLP